MKWRGEKKRKANTNRQTTIDKQTTRKIDVGTYRFAKMGKREKRWMKNQKQPRVENLPELKKGENTRYIGEKKQHKLV